MESGEVFDYISDDLQLLYLKFRRILVFSARDFVSAAIATKNPDGSICMASVSI